MIDNFLHKNSKHMLPFLQKEIDGIRRELGSYYELNEDNWDGYNAEKILRSTIAKSHKVLKHIHKYLEKNIGILNNRGITFGISPCPSGTIELSFEYDRIYEFYAFISKTGNIELMFRPSRINILDGKHTIADREVNMYWGEDIIKKETKKLTDIKGFLEEAFYEHKWSNKIDYRKTKR